MPPFPISIHSHSFPGFPALFFILVGAFVILAIIVGMKIEAKRRGEWRQLALRHGISFSPRDPFALIKSFPHFDLFSSGHSRRAYNVCYGATCGLTIRAFDYSYKTGSGKNETTHNFTVIIVLAPLTFDKLMIRPEGVFDKVAAAIGFDDIDFESAEFSRRFYVKCVNKKFAYDVIHARMMEFLLSRRPIVIEADGTAVLFHRDKRLPIPEVETLLDDAEKFLALIPDYVKNERGVGIKGER
jgi:hypothetical protein